MNQKDLKIIAHLRQNARMPLTKMSRKTGIPVSTLFDRLKLNENNIIVKHTSLLDFSKLGYHTRANLLIKVSREEREQLKDYLTKHRSVNSVYRTSNDFNLFIEGIFKEIKDMENFLEELEDRFKIQGSKVFFVIEDLKKEGFMSSTLLI